MSPDFIPQLSLGTAALVIFASCAGFVLLRGMTRILISSVIFGFSVWMGFCVWQRAPALSLDLTGKSTAWITNGFPIVAVMGVWLISRKIARVVVSPFGKAAAPESPRSFIRWIVILLFALLPTALIVLVGAMLLFYYGSVAEIRGAAEKSRGISASAVDRFSQQLKTAMQAGLPEAWSKFLGPLTEPSRLRLAKLITAQADSELKPVLDLKTGKPIPRAIVVTDPALQTLARKGDFGTLLRHPLLTEALADPKIQKLLHDLKP